MEDKRIWEAGLDARGGKTLVKHSQLVTFSWMNSFFQREIPNLKKKLPFPSPSNVETARCAAAHRRLHGEWMLLFRLCFVFPKSPEVKSQCWWSDCRTSRTLDILPRRRGVTKLLFFSPPRPSRTDETNDSLLLFLLFCACFARRGRFPDPFLRFRDNSLTSEALYSFSRCLTAHFITQIAIINSLSFCCCCCCF